MWTRKQSFTTNNLQVFPKSPRTMIESVGDAVVSLVCQMAFVIALFVYTTNFCHVLCK